MERRQQRHHPQPPPGGAAAAPDQEPPGAPAQPRLRLRDPRHPCRRRARSDDRRALNPDLPDDGLCVRRRRPCRFAVQSAQFRLHLFAADQPDRRRARGADRGARGRSRRGGGRVGACGAIPHLLHADGAWRRVCRLAQSLWRLAHAIRSVVQKARLDLPFRRSRRAGEFPQGADARSARRSSSRISPIRAALSSTSSASPKSRMRPAFRSSSTTRSRLPTSAGRSSTAPTSSSIRRRNSSRAMGRRSAASWSNRASSTGRKGTASRR